jgi:recombinational DNA repair ATPase RecF
MKIKRLKIVNLYSYENECLEDYNVVVGPNASGKTDLIRILQILSRDYSYQGKQLSLPLSMMAILVDSIRIEDNLKRNPDESSALWIELALSGSEIRILLQLILGIYFEKLNYESLKRISLVIH